MAFRFMPSPAPDLPQTGGSIFIFLLSLLDRRRRLSGIRKVSGSCFGLEFFELYRVRQE